MSKIAGFAFVALAIVSSDVYADEVCTSKWRYKVIHTDEAVDNLRIKSANADMNTAASELQKVLNRLGKKGWEVTSENKLIVGEAFDPSQNKEIAVARFDPPAVLFKKQTTTCTVSQ